VAAESTTTRHRDPANDPTTGLRRFDMRRCLGKGGFGEVYLARMKSPGGLETDVAVKMLHRNLDPDGQALQRLRDEAKMLARVDHPVVLKVHDLVPLDGHVALVTEYVDGEDLAGCIQGADAMGPRALLQAVARVAEALDAAWNAPSAQGVPLRLVHRDIKPSNIRISRHGAVKLLDFGIARSDEVTREARTATDMMIGSLAYMAPERFIEPRPHPASDVYALGCVLFEGTCQDRLLGGLSVTVQMGLSLDDERYRSFLDKRLSALPAGAHAELRALIRRTLDHDVEARPSANELAHLADVLADRVGGPSLQVWCRQRRWPASEAVQGEYDGLSLLEGTLLTRRGSEPVPVDEQEDAENEERNPRSGAWWALGIGASMVLVLGGLLALTAAAVGLWVWARPLGEAPVRPDPVADPVVLPPVPSPGTPRPEDFTATPTTAEVSSPNVAPAEASSGTDARPAPKPAPRPSLSPSSPPVTTVVVDREPVPRPPPEPVVVVEAPPSRVALADGRVLVQAVGGTVELTLVKDGRTYNPGSVPPGRYTLRAFGGDHGAVEVPPGGSVEVRCNALRQTCEVR
jgi:serine/threonine-protein kinase